MYLFISYNCLPATVVDFSSRNRFKCRIKLIDVSKLAVINYSIVHEWIFSVSNVICLIFTLDGNYQCSLNAALLCCLFCTVTCIALLCVLR